MSDTQFSAEDLAWTKHRAALLLSRSELTGGAPVHDYTYGSADVCAFCTGKIEPSESMAKYAPLPDMSVPVREVKAVS